MDLDTKSKRISFTVKLICVLLSAICVAVSAHYVIDIVDADIAYNIGMNDFNGKPLNKKVVDSDAVKSLIFNDITTMNEQVTVRDTEALKKDLLKERDKYIKSVFDDYKMQKQDYTDNGNSDVEYTNEYYLDYREVTFCIPVDLADGITFNDNDEDAKKKIGVNFDEFLNSEEYENYLSLDDREIPDSKFSVANPERKIYYSTFEAGVTDEEVLNHDYAFIVKNGVMTTSKGFEGLFADNIDKKTGKCSDFNDNYEYRLYIDSDDTTHAFYNAAISNAIKSSNTNLSRCAIGAVVFLLLALISAVILFIICGNKDENGKVKLAFIDRVPTDLHIAVTVGLQSCLAVLFVFVYSAIDEYNHPFEKLLYYSCYAIAAIVWMLFIECFTSFIRTCRSDKRLYQNTLIYLIFKYIIAKPCIYFYHLIKGFVEYNPDNFKKSIKSFIAACAALNAVFLFSFAVFNGIRMFLVLVCIAMNIAILIYSVNYIKTLDAIITAAHYRQTPQVDYNKLTNSLKTLVNSLNYSNTELKNAVDKAVRDERMRTELITNVSHDLKTPLTSIINYVDLLKGCGIEDDKAKEYIDILDEKGAKLKRLIDDLIEASKITSGVISINPMNINLSELATQAVVEHQQEFTESELELVFSGDRNEIVAFADGSKTYRIIENLISNARKYSLKGTRVYSDVYETQNFSIFEIKNTSAEPLNISVDELKERFVRGDRSRAIEGNGLGLSIADNLCTAQGGHLHITIDGDLFKAQVMLPKAKN